MKLQPMLVADECIGTVVESWSGLIDPRRVEFVRIASHRFMNKACWHCAQTHHILRLLNREM